MAHFLFIDESGQDHRESPYEVLAGVAIEDRDLWNLVQALQNLEIVQFGARYSKGERELKGKKILKRKVFRHASQMPFIPNPERARLALECMTNPTTATREQITALAQAKLEYGRELFDLCAQFRVQLFASVVNPDSVEIDSDAHLRKDYAYLFERFFYYLEDTGPSSSGIVVFDELEKSESHILVGQMDSYFKRSAKGRQRAGRIIPEPFFVHSDLTTGIQIADLAAYILSWGFRLPGMDKPARTELIPYCQQLLALRHRAVRPIENNPQFVIWSFVYISDLRPRSEQCDDK
jgi:hypothetical protein